MSGLEEYCIGSVLESRRTRVLDRECVWTLHHSRIEVSRETTRDSRDTISSLKAKKILSCGRRVCSECRAHSAARAASASSRTRASSRPSVPRATCVSRHGSFSSSFESDAYALRGFQTRLLRERLLRDGPLLEIGSAFRAAKRAAASAAPLRYQAWSPTRGNSGILREWWRRFRTLDDGSNDSHVSCGFPKYH